MFKLIQTLCLINRAEVRPTPYSYFPSVQHQIRKKGTVTVSLLKFYNFQLLFSVNYLTYLFSLNRKVYTYSWSNVWEWKRGSLAYKLANAGYKVSTCYLNLTNAAWIHAHTVASNFVHLSN